MKILSRISVVVVCALVGVPVMSTAAIDEMVPGVIEKNVDGDTLWVQSRGNANGVRERLKIRMVGIDAPETHLPTTTHGVVGQGIWGDTASDQMAKLAPLGEKVTIDDRGLDTYKRTLGRVFLGKTDVNLTMLESGWAIPYIICEGPQCNKAFFARENVEGYFDACNEARDKSKGIFSASKPLKEMPFEFRLRMQGRKPDKYVGDFETMELYKPADYKQVDLCQRVFFMRLIDAKRAGFKPTWREDETDR